MRSARQLAQFVRRGRDQTAVETFQGRASKTRLNGVSAARRNRVKPPSFTIIARSRSSPSLRRVPVLAARVKPVRR